MIEQGFSSKYGRFWLLKTKMVPNSRPHNGSHKPISNYKEVMSTIRLDIPSFVAVKNGFKSGYCNSDDMMHIIFIKVFLRFVTCLNIYCDCSNLQVKLSDRVLSTEHGLLIRTVQLSDQGLYYCLTTENGFKRTVAKIRLRVLSEAMVSVLTDKQQSPWAWASSLHPKVLLAAFSPAESLAVQQYCKERKELQNLQQRQQKQQPPPPGPLRGDLAKLKPLLDRRKSRNRRNHLPEV